MRTYSIPEAIMFLAQEYGEENMPTSEETLRRAIRTRQLIVQEDGDPGRKGYTIAEEDLREFAQKRIDRAAAREKKKEKIEGKSSFASALRPTEPIPFPVLYRSYTSGEISPEEYYQELFNEKSKWERLMYEKQVQLAQLNAQMVALQGEIQGCQSAIDAYANGISKM